MKNKDQKPTMKLNDYIYLTVMSIIVIILITINI